MAMTIPEMIEFERTNVESSINLISHSIESKNYHVADLNLIPTLPTLTSSRPLGTKEVWNFMQQSKELL